MQLSVLYQSSTICLAAALISILWKTQAPACLVLLILRWICSVKDGSWDFHRSYLCIKLKAAAVCSILCKWRVTLSLLETASTSSSWAKCGCSSFSGCVQLCLKLKLANRFVSLHHSNAIYVKNIVQLLQGIRGVGGAAATKKFPCSNQIIEWLYFWL